MRVDKLAKTHNLLEQLYSGHLGAWGIQELVTAVRNGFAESNVNLDTTPAPAWDTHSKNLSESIVLAEATAHKKSHIRNARQMFGKLKNGDLSGHASPENVVTAIRENLGKAGTGLEVLDHTGQEKEPAAMEAQLNRAAQIATSLLKMAAQEGEKKKSQRGK